MKTEELGKNVITIEIKNEFVNVECLSIGDKKKWVKNCPECGNKQIYKTEAILKKSIKLNRRCGSCLHKETLKIGEKFGKLTITNQYKGLDGRTLVDYICECGTIKTGAHITNVKNQTSCKRCQNRGITRKPLGESAFNNLLNTYKHNAKNRGHEFTLTKEQFRELTKQMCFYCGKEPTQIARYRKYNGEYLYNGVDRKDNTLGYTEDNSVPCCKFCNLTKNDTPFDQFINWIRTVNKNTEGVKI